MKAFPENLYSSESVARLDQVAIREHNIPGFTLMRRAGRAVFDVLQKKHPEANRLLVLCGAGNNAGDGYVVARLAHNQGMRVSVVSLMDPVELKGDAQQAYQQWMECANASTTIATDDFTCMDEADVIVDALLGTGLTREVDGVWKQCIEAINQSALPVIAVDVASGLNANTGAIAGASVRANQTVTFIGLKKGLFTGSGPAMCGEIVFDDLDVPEQVYAEVKAGASLLSNRTQWPLPLRNQDAHKGHYGHVLVIGGNHGMPGAVVLAAKATLRSGAGRVSVITQPAHISAVAVSCPECMVHASAQGYIPEALVEKASVIVIGPGLGKDAWAQRLLRQVLRAAQQSSVAVVYDADALNLIAAHQLKLPLPHVITPHPGEAARLLSLTPAEIQQDRFSAAQQLQQLTAGVVVLKGSGTIVHDGHLPKVCAYGSVAMATAGMGDVLSGVIAALLAQHMSIADAAAAGACLHSLAADLAAAGDTRGVLASDVIEELRCAGR